MNLAVWAERNGVARVTAYRWFHAGLLPVPARKAGRLILVDDQPADRSRRARTAVYARVSSADQKPDLDRQVARVTAWATTEQIAVDKVVTEVGSALNGHRRKFLALLRDPSVKRIVVEHRDRFCRAAQSRQTADAGRGLGDQAVFLGGRHRCRDGGRPAVRRQRLHGRISGGAAGSRCQVADDLRRQQRGPGNPHRQGPAGRTGFASVTGLRKSVPKIAATLRSRAKAVSSPPRLPGRPGSPSRRWRRRPSRLPPRSCRRTRAEPAPAAASPG